MLPESYNYTYLKEGLQIQFCDLKLDQHSVEHYL